MEQTVNLQMTGKVLNDLLKRYGLDPEVKKLGDFENYVFEAYRAGHQYIMRITHCTHRSKDEILSELDWMRHLYREGLSVPEIFPSLSGSLIEEAAAEDGSIFYGCLYSKAEGKAISVRSEQFDDVLFEKWGETTGRMHRATKNYQPSEGIKKRSSWDEDDLLQIEKYYPAEEREMVQNAKAVISSISSLPKNIDNFGIIHSDIHSGNFFYDGKEIHVFDFDDASHHWFASDIAIPLYYSLLYRIPASEKEERQRFGQKFLESFIKGYKKGNQLPEGWKEHVPLFLMLRDIVLYAVLHKKIAPEDRDEKMLKMMDEIADRIKCKEPIVKIVS